MFSNSNIIFLFILFFTISKSNLQSPGELDNNSFSPNIIVIPFKTLYSKSKNNNNNYNFSSLDYYNKIHSSKIYLNIESKNGQYLHIFVSTDESSFYLDDYFSEIGHIKCPYSSQLSRSYYFCNKNDIIYDDYNIDKSICAKDIFKLYKDDLMKEYDLTSIEFQHYKDRDKKITFSCGKTGLILSSNDINKNSNLISQIHDKNNNIDYSFTFKYTHNDQSKSINELNEGLFIIGIQSYEKEKNIEMDSLYVLEPYFRQKLGWKFNMSNIFIGKNKYYFNDSVFEINPDIDGIEVTFDFYDKLNKIFFQSYFTKGICEKEIIKIYQYIIINCKKKEFKQKDIENFPEINFFNNQIEYNFTFTGKELFDKIGGKIFFKILASAEKNKKDFILGKIFMKKYQVIFNSDYKSISFYKNNNNIIIEKKIKDKKDNTTIYKKKEKTIFYTIIYIFEGGIFIFFGIFLLKNFCNIKRKIYAKELEDCNYENDSNKNEISNSNEKLLLDV